MAINNKESCFCIPIFRDHFSFLEKNDRSEGVIPSFLKYFKEEKLFLVFSDIQEAEDCKKNIISKYNTTQIESIIHNNSFLNFDKDSHAHMGSIITRKKFFGLHHIYNNTNYKYVAAIDKDVEFIRYKDIDKCFNEFYERKTVFTTCSSLDVVKLVANGIFNEEILLRLPKINNLKNIINNADGSVNYFWFNDIPIYEKNLFLEFYEKIKDLTICNRLIFDYNFYMYFLLSENIFKLFKLKEDLNEKNNFLYTALSLLEDQNRGSLKDIKKFKLYFDYIKTSWLKFPISEKEGGAGVFLKFHVDR